MVVRAGQRVGHLKGHSSAPFIPLDETQSKEKQWDHWANGASRSDSLLTPCFWDTPLKKFWNPYFWSKYPETSWSPPALFWTSLLGSRWAKEAESPPSPREKGLGPSPLPTTALDSEQAWVPHSAVHWVWQSPLRAHWGEGAAGISRNLTSSFCLIVLLPWAGGAAGLKNRNPPGLDAALEASSDQLSAPSRLSGELRRSLSGEQVSARTSGLLGRGVEVEVWSGVPVWERVWYLPRYSQ